MNKNKIISIMLATSLISGQVLPSFAADNKPAQSTTDKILQIVKEYAPVSILGVVSSAILIKILLPKDNKMIKNNNQNLEKFRNNVRNNDEDDEKSEDESSEESEYDEKSESEEEEHEEESSRGQEVIKKKEKPTEEETEAAINNLLEIASDYNVPPEDIQNSGNKDIGLMNLGASCYLNAAIQAMYKIDSIRNKILNAQANRNSPHVLALKTAFASIALNRPLDRMQMRSVATVFDYVGEQADSNETIANILEKCNEELPFEQKFFAEGIDVTRAIPLMSQNFKNLNGNDEEIATFGMPLDENHRLFLLGRHCRSASQSSLNDPVSQECFNRILNEAGDPQKGIVTNRYRFNRLGDDKKDVVLEERIKRDSEGKVYKTYEYQYIDVGPAQVTRKMYSRDKSTVYDLTGVTMFTGSDNMGHYYLYQKCKDGNWKWFNDSRVEPIENFKDIEKSIKEKGTAFIYTSRAATEQDLMPEADEGAAAAVVEPKASQDIKPEAILEASQETTRNIAATAEHKASQDIKPEVTPEANQETTRNIAATAEHEASQDIKSEVTPEANQQEVVRSVEATAEHEASQDIKSEVIPEANQETVRSTTATSELEASQDIEPEVIPAASQNVAK